MTHGRNLAISSYLPLVALPAVHILLVALTMILSVSSPGGAYYRIFGADPLAAAVGMVSEGAIFYGVLLIWGTAWWYFIGIIGWKSRDGSISRLSSALGALLSLFSGVLATAITKDVLYQDLHDGLLSVGALLQYLCVGVLCLGAFIVATYSAMAALGRKKPG